jgi:hypothetical protein
MIDRARALLLLSECTGDDIWSIEYCKSRGVPSAWISELRDAYESGFQSAHQTIFYENRPVHQFEGIRDVDLACKIGNLLHINVSSIVAQSFSRVAVVRAIVEAIEEDG